MKSYIISVALASIFLIMAGCGGGSDTVTTEGDSTTKQVFTEVGEEVIVHKGDSITPLSSDTEIAISSTSGDSDKTVKLLSGSFELVKSTDTQE